MALVPVQELRGIGLPAIRGAGGYFVSKSKYDVAFSDLLHAVFTPIGSRPMNRSFGSSIHLILFEPLSQTTNQELLIAVRTAVAQWAPHLYIADIKAVSNKRGIALSIKFGLVEDRVTQDRVVLVTKSDVAKFISGRALA